MRSTFLEKLPLEVRLKIYEYSVYDEKPIYPNLAARHSNKFFWGDFDMEDSVYLNNAKQAELVKSSQGAPFTATSLNRTCKQIHDELKTYPVFYRVNSFHFRAAGHIHFFLAALTPQRRSMVRYIQMDHSGQRTWPYYQHSQVYRNHARLRRYPGHLIDVVALLRQCHDLRDLDYVLSPYNESETCSILKNFISNTEAVVGEPLPWDLPQFRPTIKLENGLIIDLGNRTPLSTSSLPQSYENKDEIIQLVKTARMRLASKRMVHIGDLKKRTHKNDGSVGDSKELEPELRQALLNSKLDFTGEERVAQDRFNSTLGNISSRTRGRCNPVTPLGIIDTNETLAKYDSNGILNWEIQDMTGIRWGSNGEIECEVCIRGPYEMQGNVQWESIHACIFRYGIETIIAYYTRLMKGEADLATKVQTMENTPPPKEIMKLISPITEIEGVSPTWKRPYRKSFLSHQKEYEDVLNTLHSDLKRLKSESRVKKIKVKKGKNSNRK